ncbi:MAG: OstA-like protein [Ginsengibacter sp.]
MLTPAKIFFFLIFLHVSFISFAQVTPAKPDTVKLKPDTLRTKADTVREFEIIRGPSMRSVYIDSLTTLQTIAGGAIVKQGTTIFSGDSIAINPTTHIVEAFGNVHINQADSVQTYAQYLKYIGTEKTAFLKTDVRLHDKKSTLYTQDLDYNLQTGIGNYHNGGKVINGKTTITSKDGTYYADTKDVYFKNDVVVVEPKNHITTDSLLYNMKSQGSNFSGNTHIQNKEVDIYTTQGTYDFNTGNALFTTRSTVKDSSGRIYIANNMALEDKSGNAQLEGNAIIKDSASGFIVFANQIFLHKKNNSFLATRKPVLIIKQKDDSIYVAADTIFSGYTTVVKKEGFVLKKDSVLTDSLHEKNSSDTLKTVDSLQEGRPHELKNEKDSSYYLAHLIDSLNTNRDNHKAENLREQKDSTRLTDSSGVIPSREDSARMDSVQLTREEKDIGVRDTLQTAKRDSINSRDSSRYFLAFHHVRIFTDSLQSVCDSLFFSEKDSLFRLYYDPVIWSGHSQITGDTVFLYTKNKKAERLYAFEKGMIINKTAQGFFNQISGKTINGYFDNGKIDYMRVRGSQSESIYYAQDEDSAYLGMNRATGDVIDLYFKDDDLKKVLFVNDIKGKFYPMKHIPADQKFLKNFLWLEDRRPKTKLELFE